MFFLYPVAAIFRVVPLHGIVDCLEALRQEVARAAGVVHELWGFDVARLSDDFIHRQAVPDEARNRHGRKELPFVLLEAFVQKLLEQIAEGLQVAGADDAIVLEKLDDFNEDFAVLVKKLFVVYVFDGEVVVRVEFHNAERLFQVSDHLFPVLFLHLQTAHSLCNL